MKQKGFIFISLLVWNVSTFSGNKIVPINQQSDVSSAKNNLYFLLGCRAVIPCQPYSYSDSFKWFYKKDERSDQIQIFFQDKNGMQYHHIAYPKWSKWSIGSNHSLVINYFTEDDEGMYWCETCQEMCQKSTVITVKKERRKEINKTFYIIAGNSFEHTCSGELDNINWTFEATTAVRKSGLRAKRDRVTINKSMHIGNVRREDAGKYTCWIKDCGKHSLKLLTINLCVVTVYGNNNSSVSCAGICDMKSNNPSSTSAHVDSYESLNCSTDSVFDGYTVTSHVSSSAFSKTSDIQKDPKDWIPLIYGISISCVILMALLIFCFSSRSCSAFPVQICCCGLNCRGDEESSVVYSSIVIRTPAKRTMNHVAPSDCVYSEIKQ